MQVKEVCKGCSASVKISQAEIRDAIEKLARSNKTRFVDDITYAWRQEQCKSCDCLEFGTTCRQCGCIIQVRAKLLEARCPFPKRSKW